MHGDRNEPLDALNPECVISKPEAMCADPQLKSFISKLSRVYCSQPIDTSQKALAINSRPPYRKGPTFFVACRWKNPYRNLPGAMPVQIDFLGLVEIERDCFRFA